MPAVSTPGKQKRVQVPTGRLVLVPRKSFVKSAELGLLFSRPFGTCAIANCDPGVETPGYFHKSLRDKRYRASSKNTRWNRLID
jgi:hypothetical protein